MNRFCWGNHLIVVFLAGARSFTKPYQVNQGDQTHRQVQRWVQRTASITNIWHFRGCVAPVMIISTVVCFTTVVITENKLKVVPKLLTWYQPMGVEKKKGMKNWLHWWRLNSFTNTSKKNIVSFFLLYFIWAVLTENFPKASLIVLGLPHIAQLWILRTFYSNIVQHDGSDLNISPGYSLPPLIAVHTSSYTSPSPPAAQGARCVLWRRCSLKRWRG